MNHFVSLLSGLDLSSHWGLIMRCYKPVTTAFLASMLLLATIAPTTAEEVAAVSTDSLDTYWLPEVVVTARDEAVATSGVISESIRNHAIGVNALETTNRAPSFHFSSGDGFGFYEFGQNVRLRVFNREQVSMVVDGIPLGSQATGGGGQT